jgi:hypothetical protein
MGGLLDFISDPVAMAHIEDRYRLVEHVAAQMSCTHEAARDWMAEGDRFSIETFHVGNTIDRKLLH